jgi:hypothetical protein
VFKSAFRIPSIADNAANLKKYAEICGMSICQRFVITLETEPRLISQWPDLKYAVLMPWIDGILWLLVVMQKMVLSRNASFSLALRTAEALSKIEQNGEAHCDVTGDNVVIDLTLLTVELLDVEDMFGVDFSDPIYLPAGRDGYQHRQSQHGQWCAEGDRFASSVLFAEMLTWHSPEIRDAAYGEQYFDPCEMQFPQSERYRLMARSLGNISNKLTELFGRAWHSSSLGDCPRISEWVNELSRLQISSKKSS